MKGWDRLNQKTKRDVALIFLMVAASGLVWSVAYTLGFI